MGILSFRFKSQILDLFKILNSLNWYLILFSLINLSVCIYEDQIGKFDWRQTYVGRIKFAQFDTVSTAKKIIVATEENVLAALHLKTGQVVWRHVMESASSGNIQLLHVSDKVITVTGDNPYIVRGWDPASGILLWEWSMTVNSQHAENSKWWVQNGLLVHMVPVFGHHIEVTTYNIMTGQNRGATSKLPAVWVNDGCVLSAPYYVCISGAMGSQLLLTMDVTSSAVDIIAKPLSNYIDGESIDGGLRALDGNNIVPGFIVDNKKVVLIKNGDFEVLKVDLVESASVSIIDSVAGPVLLQTWQDDIVGFALTAYSLTTSKEVPELRTLDRERRIPSPELSAAICSKTGREQFACRLLVTGDDDASVLMQQGGRVLWTREEALANVQAVEFVDLPVSDLEAAIESEFDQKEGTVWSAFVLRVSTQWSQLVSASGPQPAAPRRDYFDLHKVMVMVTRAGKIFGMDNLSGEILWSRHEPHLNAEKALIFTRRNARHPPLDAYVTIVGKHDVSGNGMLVSLNPISGALCGERSLTLDVPILQVAMLHKADQEKLHAVIVLDKDENVQIFPRSAAPLVENMFMFVAHAHTARVNGYAVRYDGTSLLAQKTWSQQLGGPGHRIVAVVPKKDDRSQSPGRVLGDRNVLYKFLDPNLVLFITEGPDPLHKDMVVSTCVDVVSGALSYGAAHRRARALPLAVHVENMLAYFYYNDKLRRTEIASVELYEGSWRVSVGAVSSLGAQVAAGAAAGALLVGATPTAMGITTTLQALTDRHVLVALSSGALVQVPWSYLDPRRTLPPRGDDPLPPPTPELLLHSEAVLNYNQSLANVRRVHTAPAGIESTCLVLATGLDLFYTRVAPSKTFDLLKDDFDYYLITIVLAGLIVATYSSKYFAARKMLKMAWKGK